MTGHTNRTSSAGRRINGLRGLLTEYGEVMPQGRAGMKRGIGLALERISERLPAIVVETLREQWVRVARLDEEIGEIERRLLLWHRGRSMPPAGGSPRSPVSGCSPRPL